MQWVFAWVNVWILVFWYFNCIWQTIKGVWILDLWVLCHCFNKEWTEILNYYKYTCDLWLLRGPAFCHCSKYWINKSRRRRVFEFSFRGFCRWLNVFIIWSWVEAKISCYWESVAKPIYFLVVGKQRLDWGGALGQGQSTYLRFLWYTIQIPLPKVTRRW